MESEKCRPPSRHLTVDEVPDHFRELYIQSAYRNPNSSFAECLRSVFEATNETFNFWTHILPSMYFIWWMYAIFPDVSSDAYPVPFIAYSVSVCVFPVASALAHVFNTMSDHARHVCFFVDYAGLSFYALGSAVAYKAYSFPRSLGGTVFAEIYFPCAAIMAVLSMTLCCATRLMPNSFLKKILRMSSMAFPYLFDVIPVVYRYLFEDTEDLTQGIYPHMRQFIFTFLSAFFYISHLPERAFPGYFDVFGHSHQIFHTMSILGARDQLQAVLLDLKDRRHLSTVMVDQEESGISFHVLSIIVMSLVSMINIIQLLVFSSQLHHVIPQGIGTRKLAAWQHHRRASLNCCDQATDEVENFCFDHRFPTKADSANNNAMIIKRRKIMLEYIE